MKATGILRRVDDLGRIVIPKDIRRTLRIHEGDALEIYTDEDMVCFKRYDIEKNHLAELKRLSDSIAEYYWSPENSDNLKIINIAIHEIELQLKAIAERED